MHEKGIRPADFPRMGDGKQQADMGAHKKQIISAHLPGT
jgi:hypothetical protein